ncbi:hypothetical protein TEU_10850 [Thermococcus eurythermalis]|uniref:Uncharacterized protein n=1 Tax=Thermococcus eurythermalis TaxID=1505907 RepID=A0A097QWD7_9EURY|nr:hypothetical protein [Thermococcus eurythermalis]AIU70790.1 hypothetical protein TEU_10850 [Thermococcus eurythermalis]
MNVEELIAMGELEAAREVLRNIDRRKLNNGELSDYTRNVINLGLAFRENGKLDDGVNTIVALLDDLESISWGLWRLFYEYLEECTPERAREVWERVYLIPGPREKAEILQKVGWCLDDPNEKRKVLVEAFTWALHVKGRSWRTYTLSKVLGRVHDVNDYDLMLELCRRIKRQERRLVFEDFLFEGESAETCEEFVEVLKRRSGSADALELLIGAYLEHEEEFLRSRGFNPKLYKLVPRKTSGGVTFHAVLRPLYPLVILHWKLRELLKIMRD